MTDNGISRWISNYRDWSEILIYWNFIVCVTELGRFIIFYPCQDKYICKNNSYIPNRILLLFSISIFSYLSREFWQISFILEIVLYWIPTLLQMNTFIIKGLKEKLSI